MESRGSVDIPYFPIGADAVAEDHAHARLAQLDEVQRLAAAELVQAEADLRRLGALVYTMLTGAPPYSGGRATEELRTSRSTRERIERYKKLIDESDSPTAHHDVEGVDRALGEILDRCLEKSTKTTRHDETGKEFGIGR